MKNTFGFEIPWYSRIYNSPKTRHERKKGEREGRREERRKNKEKEKRKGVGNIAHSSNTFS